MKNNQVFGYETVVKRTEKESNYRQKGIVYWFTGLSGSGKSTVANCLEKRLNSMGFVTMILDGDNLRNGLCKGLGFSFEDRKENIRRAAEVAKLNAQNGIIVLSCFISPLESDRQMAREIIGDDFVEVFVNTPLSTCEERDTKGLYKKARAGEIKNFTGIDMPYESPKNPELGFDTTINSIEYCSSLVENHYSEIISKHVFKRKLKGQDDWSFLNHGNSKMNLTNNQHAIFIGRFQPLHEGHIRLFRQKLDQGIPVLIMVRDLSPDDNNPFTTNQTIEMINIVFKGEKVKAISIPDIESVNWGRGVGYELNEYFPPANIGAISATQIRKFINEGTEDWKKLIDPKIHEYISNIFSGVST